MVVVDGFGVGGCTQRQGDGGYGVGIMLICGVEGVGSGFFGHERVKELINNLVA